MPVVWLRALVLALVLSLPGAGARAQVVRDGSLGDPGAPLAVPSGVDPNGDFATFLIESEYGEQRGSNLFHSFGEFSTAPGEVATFTGPDLPSGPQSVDHVFSRVTGGDPSNLFGTLRSTIPGADLFFVNAAGVFFGPESKVDVPGSLHVATANEIRFEGGAVWPTDTASAGGSLLAATPPSAFGFTRDDPAPIAFDGAIVGTAPFLTTLPAGETLSFVGGDVRVAGRNAVFQTIRIESGTVQIASVGGPAEVPVDVASFDVDALAAEDLGSVTITDAAFLNVGGSDLASSPGGRVVIRGGQLVVDGVSQISSGTFGDADGAPVAVDVQVKGRVDIRDSSTIEATSFFADGRGGDLRFEAGEMVVREGSLLSAQTIQGPIPGLLFGTGDGGDVVVGVDGTFRVEGAAQVVSASGNPFASEGGAGGDIRIDASAVEIENGAVTARTFGEGAAGSIAIAADRVDVSGPTASVSAPGAAGPGGSIGIDARELRIDEGALVTVSTLGSGDAGTIRIDAEDVTLDGTSEITGSPSGLLSQSVSGVSGAAGSIELRVADTLSITNGAQISVSSQSVSSGASGSIDIETGTLLLKNSVDGIRAASRSQNNDAGDVRIRASDRVKIEDGSISTRADLASGGNVEISAGKLIQLRRTSLAPEIPLVTAEVAPSQLTRGGNVTLSAQTVVIGRAGVKASAPGGAGGNIEISADGFLVSGGDLREEGPGFYASGGELFSPAPGQLVSTGSYFDVSGALQSGSFEVRSPDAAVVANLTALPQEFLDVAVLQTNQCAARSAPVGSLVVAGRDRVPVSPADRIRGSYGLEM